MPVRVSKRFDKRTMEGKQSSDGKYRSFLANSQIFHRKQKNFSENTDKEISVSSPKTTSSYCG